MNSPRKAFYKSGLLELPKPFVDKYLHEEGKNGETLQYDEAEVWKRVLNYRIANELQPRIIFETHGGKGLSTELYRIASPMSTILSSDSWESDLKYVPDAKVDLIDIDPFGQPYSCIETVRKESVLSKLKKGGVLMVSNGEMMGVARHLKNTQHIKTDYYGRNSWKWVVEQYLPYMEEITGLKVQFFYAFPTTVRVILSNKSLPVTLFKGCKQWMWWLEKYAGGSEYEVTCGSARTCKLEDTF